MSYCRFSSMTWRCDVYAYETDDGFVVHVAGRRHAGPIPALPDILTVPLAEFQAAYERQHEALDACELVKIGLPCDGETFCLATEEDMVGKLQELAAMGYVIPDDLLDWPLDEGAG